MATMSTSIFERFVAHEKAASKNPPDQTSLEFSKMDPVVRFERFLADLRDKGEEPDEELVELAAREMGLGDDEIQRLQEAMGGWW